MEVKTNNAIYLRPRSWTFFFSTDYELWWYLALHSFTWNGSGRQTDLGNRCSVEGRLCFFTITKRILTRWLVESYGLCEYRPWKWRNIFRETSQETKNKCYCKKQIDQFALGWKKRDIRPQFSMVYTLLDHRHYAFKCWKLCSETWVLNILWRHFYGLWECKPLWNCGRLVKYTPYPEIYKNFFGNIISLSIRLLAFRLLTAHRELNRNPFSYVACEQQTHFRSSLLSLRNDDRKCHHFAWYLIL